MLLHIQDDIYLNPLTIDEIKYHPGKRSYYFQVKHPLWIKREQALYEKSSWLNRRWMTAPKYWYNKAKWEPASISFWQSGKLVLSLGYDSNKLAKEAHEHYLIKWTESLEKYKNDSRS